MLIFIITSLKTINNITTTSNISKQPISNPLYIKHLKNNMLTNNLNSFISTIFNTFPNSYFKQNNKIIQLTNITNHYINFIITLILIILNLFPTINNFIQHIPKPILNNTTLIIFNTITTSNIHIISHKPLNHQTILIITLSLTINLNISQQPLILQFTPK